MDIFAVVGDGRKPSDIFGLSEIILDHICRYCRSLILVSLSMSCACYFNIFHTNHAVAVIWLNENGFLVRIYRYSRPIPNFLIFFWQNDHHRKFRSLIEYDLCINMKLTNILQVKI